MMLLVAFVVILAFVLRLIGLGSFMTADEPNWMLRSSEFWHKLFVNHDAGGTFITTHPGVTAMWLIGTGETAQEKRLGIAVDTSTLSHFHFSAALPIAVATSLLIGFISFCCMRLWGVWPGVMAGFLLAVEPYGVGMSQIAHLDALLAVFLLSAVCAFLVGARKQSTFFVLIAGVLAGLAAGTKLLPSLVFLPWAALVAYGMWPGSVGARLRRVIRYGGLVVGTAGLTLFIMWPALWAKTDIGQSVSRDTATVVSTSHTEITDEGGGDVIAPWSFYARTLLGRTTPFVLILCLAAVILLLKQMMRKPVSAGSMSVTWMVVFAIAFLAMVALVAKKSDRYALPALSALPLIAGWVCAGVWQMAAARQWRFRYITAVAVSVLLIMQALLWVPYTIAYNSTWFSGRPLSQQGWGEGLDAAGRWLNTHPLGSTLTVASWYPNVLATYFNGATFSLSSRNDPRVGYVVLYRNMLGRGGDEAATNIWDEYKEKTPAKVISIGGLPYVWIFETFGIPYFSKNTGELLPGAEVGQTVPAEHDGLDKIDIGLSTFSGRAKNADVILHVRESLDASEDIRTVRKVASEVADSDWNTFLFEPISGSAQKTYYIALTTATGKEGDALTVRYAEDDIKPGQMVWRRRGLQVGENQSSFLRRGDVAYRLQ